jgi:ATP-dependent helicase HepA
LAEKFVQAINAQDEDRSLDDFMIDVFVHFSIHVEELGNRVYQLGSAGVFADSFPGLPAHGLTITCERQRALSREDVQFLTWDHPLVTGALDMLLGSEKGNSSFAVWPDTRVTGLYLEAIYLLECVAPPTLHVDRFLPPTPLRVLVDFKGNDAGQAVTSEVLARQLRKGDAYPLLDQPELREELLPAVLKKAERLANERIPDLVAEARREMAAQLEHEILRLKDLQKVNRSVRDEEITLLNQQRDALNENLKIARLRLDAVRLIHRGAG